MFHVWTRAIIKFPLFSQQQRNTTQSDSCSLHPERLLLVHVGEHEGDVGGEEVVHLVAERGLARQLGAPHQVSDGHVEVGVPTRPVGDPSEGVSHQNILNCWIIFGFLLCVMRNQLNSAFNQKLIQY